MNQEEQLNQAFYESLGWKQEENMGNTGGPLIWVGLQGDEILKLPPLTIDTVRNAVMGLPKNLQSKFANFLANKTNPMCKEYMGYRFTHELTTSDWRDAYLKTIGKI